MAFLGSPLPLNYVSTQGQSAPYHVDSHTEGNKFKF